MEADGKSQVKYGGKPYDMRVSTIPTSYGETVTIRILNPASAGMGLENLGLSERAIKDFSNAISIPQGIILVTGPTGSGKSSTLYACLNRLNTPEVNIITVEDPVEFDIQGINQVQVNPKA
ncbi:MAG: Flp pilus assembly complex ATPase component TadA, partial [Deltaproteobacteria bacterium]|nr:Flp pilus assembly complex ATPase component TadA [Deltaproteobacteria bacterium]